MSLYFYISVFSERLCELTWWRQLGEDHTAQVSSSSTSWEQPGPQQPQDRPPSGRASVQRNDASTCKFVCVVNNNMKKKLTDAQPLPKNKLMKLFIFILNESFDYFHD